MPVVHLTYTRLHHSYNARFTTDVTFDFLQTKMAHWLRYWMKHFTWQPSFFYRRILDGNMASLLKWYMPLQMIQIERLFYTYYDKLYQNSYYNIISYHVMMIWYLNNLYDFMQVWRLRLKQKKMNNPRKQIIYFYVRELHTPWSHKESILFFIFMSWKLITTSNISKIYQTIDTIGQFEVPNTIVIEEQKELSTFNTIIKCAKVDIIFVSVTRNSRDLTSLKQSPALHSQLLSPAPHMFYSHMKQN